MADEFDLDAALAEIGERKPEVAPEPTPKVEAPKRASAPRAVMERAARPVVKAAETVPEVEPVAEPTIDAATAQREIGKQRVAFDAAYQAGVDRYRREHDPRAEAFREHNEEIAGIVAPAARTAMERAAYVPSKAWEGLVAADAAYDELPFVKEGRARFADAENRPETTERPKPEPARAPTIDMPEVETPPSPGFDMTEEFEVGEEPKREPSPADVARSYLRSLGATDDQVPNEDADAIKLADYYRKREAK